MVASFLGGWYPLGFATEDPEASEDGALVAELEKLQRGRKYVEMEALVVTRVPRRTLAAVLGPFSQKNGMLPATAMACGFAAREALGELGFDSRHVLYANSLCPDEVNRKSPWWDLLLGGGDAENASRMTFNLGGLAGLPAVGTTGFAACASHVSDRRDGTACVFVVCGSHVGVSRTGQVGAVVRERQSTRSTACCGAACAAMAWAEGVRAKVDDVSVSRGAGSLFARDADDPQMDACKRVVLRCLAPHGPVAPGDQAALAEAVYGAAFSKVCDLVPKGGLNAEVPVVVLGGLQINTDRGLPDFFAPRDFVVFPRGSNVPNAKMAFFEKILNRVTSNAVPLKVNNGHSARGAARSSTKASN